VIGILGGTFDPIHCGHLRSALEVQEQLSLRALHLIPCHVPPHRSPPVAAAEHRAAMAARAVAGVPGFVLDRRELRRPGPSYTVVTLEELRSEFGPNTPLLLLLGRDALAGFARWERWRAIPTLAHLVVLERPGESPTAADLPVPEGVQRAPTAEALGSAPAGLLWSQPVTQLAISATFIRQQLHAGYSARFLVPDSVYDYIQHKGLYRPNHEEKPLTLNAENP